MANDNKLALNLIGILMVFLLCWLAVYFVMQPDWLPSTGGQDQAKFFGEFQHYAFTVIGVAFGCTLLWFALGEWAIPPWAPSRTWYLTWFALLLVVLVTGCVMAAKGPKVEALDPVNYTIAAYYLAFGVLPFWIATACFSPVSGKFIVWPAKLVRTW